jgi:putative ABC transport system permease protein
VPGLWRDFTYAARSLRKNPAFALTAIFTLALGIGASSAIFSVVNAVLLRPLPYPDPDRVAIITEDLRVRKVSDFLIGAGDIYDIRREATFFDGIAALFTANGAAFGPENETPEPINLARATTNIFKVLGVPVVHGRNFTDDDGIPNQPITIPGPGVPATQAAPAVQLPTVGILGFAFWERKFGGDTSIIGRNIILLGQPVQIVGIASPRAELIFPPSMHVERHPDIWTALRVNFETGSRQNVQFRLVGRIKRGVTVAAARGQITHISDEITARFPVRKTSGATFRLEPMQAYVVAGVRNAIIALMGAVLFVLVIACANVANLLLVRASQRERELAVRAAMGGSPAMIVRQLLAESFLLAAVAAVVGVALAQAGVVLLLQLAPADLPRLTDVSIDPAVLAFTVLASFASAILFGLVPAIRASRPRLADVLRATGRAPSLVGAAGLRNAVIVAEVALSFVLLTGSGLMIRSFVELTRIDPGFEPNGLLTFGIGNIRLRSADEAAAFSRTVRQALSAIPGVSGVTGSLFYPFDGADAFARWGTQAANADPTLFRQCSFSAVLPGYFDVMKTRLIAGRAFTDADNTPVSNVVILDEWAARLAFKNESAIGKTVLARIRTEIPEIFTVIGVVAHERHTTLTGDEKETLFFPEKVTGIVGSWAVRTTGDPARLGGAVRAAIQGINKQYLVSAMRPMTDLVDTARAPTRFALVLMAVFAAIAAILAAVGLYGVLSSVVRQRTPEIGIRMAFGSQSSGIFSLIIGHGLKLSAVGIVIGIAIALAATRVMVSMLVGVAPTDPLTFIAMVVVFLVVATLACWIPARRAAGLDPNAALREE